MLTFHIYDPDHISLDPDDYTMVQAFADAETTDLLLTFALHDGPRHFGVTRIGQGGGFYGRKTLLDDFTGEQLLALLRLIEDPSDLCDVLGEVDDVHNGDVTEAVEALTGNRIDWCYSCSDVEWVSDGRYDADGDYVCRSCFDNSHFECRCGRVFHMDNGRVAYDGVTFCESCADDRLYWCDDCDDLFYDPHDHDEEEACSMGGCDAPNTTFHLPHGDEDVRQDQRVRITLPAGSIDEEGVKAIYSYLVVNANLPLGSSSVWEIVSGLDPTWQTKAGNFTKRLGKALYARGVKLAPATMSEVGNLARAHTSTGSSYWIEVTRDLNQSAEDFFHEGSCWWGSHSESRCCLKNWGGFGLRSYNGSNAYGPAGRAWVQPLDSDFEPTHDTVSPYAYVVYNGYGNLSGFIAARIIAQMVGMTYRKVSLDIDGQYVNNATGYLVAPTAVCEETEAIEFYGDPHDTRDAATVRRSTQEVAA